MQGLHKPSTDPTPRAHVLNDADSTGPTRQHVRYCRSHKIGNIHALEYLDLMK